MHNANENQPAPAPTADAPAVLKRRTVQERPVKDLGVTIRVRRVATADMLRITHLPRERQVAALVAACVVGPDDRPVYGSVEEVEQTDWEVIGPVSIEVTAVNAILTLEAAGKK